MARRSPVRLDDQPVVLGTIFQGNECRRCERAYTIGEGVVGSVLAGNQPSGN